MAGVVEVMIRQSYFTTEVRGSARYLSGKENYFLRTEIVPVLACRDVGSLVVDRLFGQASGQRTAIAPFYFSFAAGKERPTASMVGSWLRQVVGAIKKILEKNITDRSRAEKGPCLTRAAIPSHRENAMIQAITSSLYTFVCIDALDECSAAHRVNLHNSLQQILERSPCMRIAIILRPHLRAKIEKRLAGRVKSIPVDLSKDVIMEYSRVRLDGEGTPYWKSYLDSSIHRCHE